MIIDKSFLWRYRASKRNRSHYRQPGLPGKVQEINAEIARLDTLLAEKNKERGTLIAEVTKTPTINLPGYETLRKPGKTNRTVTDSLGNKQTIVVDTIYTERKYTSTAKENPAALIPTLT